MGVILFPANQGVTATGPMSLCSLLSFTLHLTLPVCLKVPSRDWLSTPKIGFSSLLAWVAVTCISLSESPKYSQLYLYITYRGIVFGIWRKKVTFIKSLIGPYSKQKVAASSDPHDTVIPSTGFFNPVCKKLLHTQSREIWFYFMSMQKWEIGGVKSTKLAPLQYARCSFLCSLNNKNLPFPVCLTT